MKVTLRAERPPRWKDCRSFALAGVTVLLVMLLSKGSDAALWFGIRWGGLTV